MIRNVLALTILITSSQFANSMPEQPYQTLSTDITEYVEKSGKWANRLSMSAYEGSSTPALYDTITASVPDVGLTTTVYMGDLMVQQRRGFYSDCIIPTVEFSKTTMGTTFHLKKNRPMCKTSTKDKWYWPDHTNAIHDGHDYVYALQYKSKKKNKSSICFKMKGMGMMSAGCKKKIPDGEVKSVTGFVSVLDNMQRTIEYSGKKGDSLKFIYSEFSGGMARDAFTREFEIDLSEGNVLAYKGAVIEVIKATNATIEYKVVRGFKQS